VKLKERYILWRLTPAEQLIYRMLQKPEEWDRRGDYCITHKQTRLELWIGDTSGSWQVFEFHNLPGFQHVPLKPKPRVQKLFFRLAWEIRYPPRPSTEELQRQLFERLMKAELGEK
jgi:hypothetical protein